MVTVAEFSALAATGGVELRPDVDVIAASGDTLHKLIDLAEDQDLVILGLDGFEMDGAVTPHDASARTRKAAGNAHTAYDMLTSLAGVQHRPITASVARSTTALTSAPVCRSGATTAGVTSTSTRTFTASLLDIERILGQDECAPESPGAYAQTGRLRRSP